MLHDEVDIFLIFKIVQKPQCPLFWERKSFQLWIFLMGVSWNSKLFPSYCMYFVHYLRPVLGHFQMSWFIACPTTNRLCFRPVPVPNAARASSPTTTFPCFRGSFSAVAVVTARRPFRRSIPLWRPWAVFLVFCFAGRYLALWLAENKRCVRRFYSAQQLGRIGAGNWNFKRFWHCASAF